MKQQQHPNVSPGEVIFATSARYLYHIFTGKDPGLAALDAAAFALPHILPPPPPAAPPPSPKINEPHPVAEQAPAMNAKTAERLARLDAKAGHPDTPRHEAEAAGVLAAQLRWRLKHGGR